jgi:hypothetical protein
MKIKREHTIFFLSLLLGLLVALVLRFAINLMWNTEPGSFPDTVLDGISIVTGIIIYERFSKRMRNRSSAKR